MFFKKKKETVCENNAANLSDEEEKMNDVDNWSDPYGDEQSYNDGWSKEDIESGLADAFEGDLDATWNKE